MAGQVRMEMPISGFLWMFFFDAIHHRGQLSTYIRPMAARCRRSTDCPATIRICSPRIIAGWIAHEDRHRRRRDDRLDPGQALGRAGMTCSRPRVNPQALHPLVERIEAWCAGDGDRRRRLRQRRKIDCAAQSDSGPGGRPQAGTQWESRPRYRQRRPSPRCPRGPQASEHPQGSAGCAARFSRRAPGQSLQHRGYFKTLETEAHRDGDCVGIPLASDDDARSMRRRNWCETPGSIRSSSARSRAAANSSRTRPPSTTPAPAAGSREPFSAPGTAVSRTGVTH